ncbi:uncharacterized protein BP5553_10358 [Venustampulla echinocandica]|uniref:Uncharacterized protein n=1 Tax=Venustampulla echinocandica TaxID=2656787 RepID=A0A370T9Y9_9HELO|nr:uncharacterized protein BP5553_10358 [Venustampulla echinocandica]RDL30480.1 hypothetical protein BP5553_10358 [Venustampulla echinocandica]
MSFSWSAHDRQSPPAAGPSRVSYPPLPIPNPGYFTPQPTSAHHDQQEAPVVPPRRMQERHAERAYILNSLRRENSKATVLLERISALEGGLHRKAPYAERKANKQLGWLKHRLNETNQQENAMLTRLGQLTSDIQSMEAWLQNENERLQQNKVPDTPFQMCNNMQQLNLDPTSPEFRPRGYQMQWDSVQWPSKESQSEYRSDYQVNAQGKAAVPQGGLNMNNICPTGQCLDDGMTQSDLVPVLLTTPRSSSLDSAMLDASFTSPSPMELAVAKRNSLPAIPGLSMIWALTDKEKGEEIGGYESSHSLHSDVMM